MHKNLLFLIFHFIFWLIYQGIRSNYIDFGTIVVFCIICSIIFIIAVVIARIVSRALNTGRKGFTRIGLTVQITLSSVLTILLMYNHYTNYKKHAEDLKTVNECYDSNLQIIKMLEPGVIDSMFKSDTPILKGQFSEESYDHNRLALARLTERINRNSKIASDTIFCIYYFSSKPVDTILKEKHYSFIVEFNYSLERRNENYYAIYGFDSAGCEEIHTELIPQKPKSKIKLIDRWLREHETK